MKIGIYFNAPFGGAFHLLENHVKQLSRRHEIFLYSIEIDQSVSDLYGLKYNPELIPSLKAYASRERRFKDPRSSNGWYKKIHRWGWGIRRFKAYIKGIDLNLSKQSAVEIGSAFETDACDVVIGHPDKLTHVPLPLGKTSLPTVFFCVEPNRSLYDGGNLSQLLAGTPDRFTRKLAKLDRWLADSITQFACNSYYTRDSIYHAYGKLAWVIPSGVDVAAFKPDPQIKKENLVLCVGVLMKHKVPEFLLQSIAQIEERYRPRVAFVYPRGSEMMRAELQGYADANCIEVEFHPRVQTKDLVELYNRARVCAYPPIMEPGGLVPLEAQACGTPVVAVNEGGNREELLHGVTGFLTNRDPQEFGATIEKLIRDDQLASQMGKAGADWVNFEWTWEKIVPRLERALQNLVKL